MHIYSKQVVVCLHDSQLIVLHTASSTVVLRANCSPLTSMVNFVATSVVLSMCFMG